MGIYSEETDRSYKFLDAVEKWLERKGIGVDEVLYVLDERDYTGYCETCYDSEPVWIIVYRNDERAVETYKHEDYLGNFIRELTDAP